MSRYRSRTQLDDAIIPNGDGGFVGFETRRHPTQLEAGLAQFLQNQRIDNNVAKVRKGIDRLTADTEITSDPLILPFGLGLEVSLSSITSSGTTATATLSATPVTAYDNGDTIEIQGADQSEYNGAFTLTVVSPTVFTYTMLSDPAVDTATGTLTASPVLGAAGDGVYASTLFSDVESDTEYVAMAMIDKVLLVNPDDPTNTIDVPYKETTGEPAEQLEETDNGDIVQVGNGLVINRGKLKKALEWDGNIFNSFAANVTSITRSGTIVTVNTDVEHDYREGDLVTIAGAVESDYNGDQTIEEIIDADTFTYLTTATPTTPATGTITVTKVPQFEVVADSNFAGFLSMPQAEFSVYHPFARLVIPVRILFYDVSSLTRSGSVVTVTTSDNHGILVGDRVKIENANGTDYNGVQEVTKAPTATTFEFVTTGAPTTPDTSTNIKVKIDVRDMFIFSDIYDHHTYDPVNNLFRINRGTADNLVALKTFQNDNVIALYEKSIHVIVGVSEANLNNASVWLITDEVGCIARKTVEIIGNQMIFLSEQGVYMLEITRELNMRGREIPLSRDIQDQFDPAVLAYGSIGDAVATYFNNRYYIALPAFGETRNTIVYVYNFINGKWESKDTFATANYIDNWVVCRKGGKDRLFATSREGSLQLYEELDHDELGASPTNTEIIGQLITRRYSMGNSTNLTVANPFAPLEINRFVRGSANMSVLNGDVVSITASTEDPDASATVASYTFTATETHHKRFRINKRGTACEIQIDSTVGRPTIRSISVEGTELQRANKNTE